MPHTHLLGWVNQDYSRLPANIGKQSIRSKDELIDGAPRETYYVLVFIQDR